MTAVLCQFASCPLALLDGFVASYLNEIPPEAEFPALSVQEKDSDAEEVSGPP